MHEELNGLESGDGSQNDACGSRRHLPRVSAACEAVVMRLRSAVGSVASPIGDNIARRAALSAVALARHPVRHARVTPASWPPLPVPSHEAGWLTWQLRSAAGLREPATIATGTDAASSFREEVAAKRIVDAAVGETAASATRPFSFRPGGRFVPRFSIGHGAGADVHTDVTSPAERAAIGQRPGPTIGTYVRKAARWTAIAFAVWFGLMFVLIFLFRFVDPPGSTLILWQALSGTKIEQRWVPMSRISSNLKRAVVVSEDGRFCQHWGVDPREVMAAIRRSRGGVPRGASTITMQVAKNLFLWPSKSYLRKALEVPLAFSLELLWPKSRILEVYLNIAEWGPGIFGAEAAAQHHFHKPASRLNRWEAALLAVALPNPIDRRAGKPGPGTARLASLIQSRARVSGDAAGCVLRSP